VTHVRLTDAGPAAGPGVREISAEPSEDLRRTLVPSEGYRRSATALEAIATAYGDRPPDYLEAWDRGAPAIVPLTARRGRHRSLIGTHAALRLAGGEELDRLHDAALSDPAVALVSDLEREPLRLADRLLWPGGAGLDLYREYYPGPLPAAARIGLPLDLPEEVTPSGRESGVAERPLRILYVGPISRGAGAGDLAEACLRLGGDWRLTMAGEDTTTATFRLSMREAIEAMFDGDPRLELHRPPSPERFAELAAAHDLLVAPSRFELWPERIMVAMALGLPVLATPVGGQAEIVEDGTSGWLARGTGPAAIVAALGHLVDRPDELERVRRSGAPAARARQLAAPGPILDSYEQLFEELGAAADPRPAPRAGSEAPLVSAIVPYFRSSAHVEEAIASLFTQTHPNVEAVVVNDGSFEEGDEVLLDLARMPGVRVVTQLNSGEAAARNLGLVMARGELVLLLDSDNVLEPEFVARAVEVLEREPDLAYVGCWLSYIEPDGGPQADPTGGISLGNRVIREYGNENWDGDTLAVLRRDLLLERGGVHEPEGGSHADWELYRQLHDEGRFGMVIPEKLARYRVRPDSLMRVYAGEIRERTMAEMRDRRIRNRVRWTVGPE
jgi:glycosyltransferase involved in cell wall biosynthesis